MSEYKPISSLNDVKKRINETLSSNPAPHKQKPVFVNGNRYSSLFDAGINSGVSYVSLSQGMTKSEGAPAYIKGRLVVLESWILSHPEYLKEVPDERNSSRVAGA